jgi:hypothetical protein
MRAELCLACCRPTLTLSHHDTACSSISYIIVNSAANQTYTQWHHSSHTIWVGTKVIGARTCVLEVENEVIGTMTCVLEVENEVIGTMTCVLEVENEVIGTMTCVLEVENEVIGTMTWFFNKFRR